MNKKKYSASVEAILFACAEPISAQQIAQALDADSFEIQRVLLALQKEYQAQGRGIVLMQLENRWQMAANVQFLPLIQKVVHTKKNTPLSSAALEVLAIIAYNQPVSRSFVEQIRGVDSSNTIQKLLKRGLIEEAERLNLPGRPISFVTTDIFLRTFGLNSLKELPPLHEKAIEVNLLSNQSDIQEMDQSQELPPEDEI